MITSILNAIFPPLCVHCRREGDWLCAAARAELATESVIVDPLTVRGVDHVIVRGAYDTATLAQLVQQIKYHYWHGCADILTEVLQPLAKHLHHQAVIVPVPLHPRRRRERGFNQSDLIASALSQVTQFPLAHLLRRVRYTMPQAQLSAKARVKNVVGAIGKWSTTKWPSAVILVDDVITTGSTIAECATILQKNGVQKIIAVAIAKG